MAQNFFFFFFLGISVPNQTNSVLVQTFRTVGCAGTSCGQFWQNPSGTTAVPVTSVADKCSHAPAANGWFGDDSDSGSLVKLQIKYKKFPTGALENKKKYINPYSPFSLLLYQHSRCRRSLPFASGQYVHFWFFRMTCDHCSQLEALAVMCHLGSER